MDHPDDTAPSDKPLGVSAADAISVGQRLAAARDKRRVSLTELARKVRIREHFAQAIETGNWGSLPPGLNGRGLVRIYARELGVAVPELDPSAHLTASNARVERAEQELAEEALKAQTIRTYASPSQWHREGSGARPSDAPARGRGGQESAGRAGQRRPAAIGDRVPKNNGYRAQPVVPPQVRREVASDNSDDEAPLDVVTPDIAAVLGIDLSEGDQNRDDTALKAGRATAAEADDVPGVNVADVLGIGIEEPAFQNQTSPPMPPASASAPVSASEPLPISLPMVEVPPDSRAGILPPVSVPATEPEPPVSGIHSYVEQIARTRPEPASAADLPLSRGGSADEAAASEIALGARQRRQARLRSTLVLGATAAALVAFGFFYLMPLTREREQRPQIEDMGQDGNATIKDLAVNGSEGPLPSTSGQEPDTGSAAPQFAGHDPGSSGSAPEPGVQQPAGVAPAESPQAAAEPPVTAAAEPPVAAAPQMVPPAAAPGAQAPAAAPVASDGSMASAPSDQSQPKEAKPVEVTPRTSEVASSATKATPEASVAAAATEPSAPALGTGAARAVLHIKSPVVIQIRADGRLLSQGERPAGPLEFRFSGRAEIMIDDGSKVELDYAGWSHGPLGHAGRKRRIVLNSADF